MKVIRKSELIQSVAKRWRKEYCYVSGKWRHADKEEIHKRLLALGEDATEEQITCIIGIGSWMTNTCSECGRDVELTVHFGEEPDYDAVWADICPDCLQKAVALIAKRKKSDASA